VIGRFASDPKTAVKKKKKYYYYDLRVVLRGGEPIISVRHLHDGVGQQRCPATARGHRPVRRPRYDSVAVLPRHVDGRFR